METSQYNDGFKPHPPHQKTDLLLFNVVYQLKREGRRDSTLASISRKLRYLNKHVDLNHPDKVKEYIATLQCSDGHKDNLTDIYSHYADFYGIQWVFEINHLSRALGQKLRPFQ